MWRAAARWRHPPRFATTSPRCAPCVHEETDYSEVGRCATALSVHEACELEQAPCCTCEERLDGERSGLRRHTQQDRNFRTTFRHKVFWVIVLPQITFYSDACKSSPVHSVEPRTKSSQVQLDCPPSNLGRGPSPHARPAAAAWPLLLLAAYTPDTPPPQCPLAGQEEGRPAADGGRCWG